MECRLAYSREWAIRMVHEAQMHDRSCFLTLTYDQDNLPPHGQLVKSDLQKFIKRVRKRYPVRYVACGEYGEISRRPHFHLAVFGEDWRSGSLLAGRSVDAQDLYVHPALNRLWPFGLHRCGSLTFSSAGYIARYITKRIQGPGASPAPIGYDQDNNPVLPEPEFLVMSRRPFVGYSWYKRFFASDVQPHGRVVTPDGVSMPIPRAYKRQFLRDHCASVFSGPGRLQSRADFDTLLQDRFYHDLDRFVSEDQPDRRRARGVVHSSRSKLFNREVPDGHDI